MNNQNQIKKSQVGNFPSDIFVSAFKHSGIGMALMGLDGSWIDVNVEITRMTGYSREELLSMTFQQITYPDDLSRDLQNLNRLSQNEVANYTVEKRYVTKSRKVIWVSVTVSLVREHDKPQFFISQIVNIDERMELARKLEIKMNELELARVTLDARIRQLEHLNYTLAHNLRGPLKNFQLIAQALLSQHDPRVECNDLTGALSEDQGLRMLAHGSNKLAEDLDQLLAVTSRQNSGLDLQNCDLRLMVEEILAQHSVEIFEKQAEFVFRYEVEHLAVPKAYLASILYNLISNALKYADLSRQPRIEIESYSIDGRKHIKISDNGIGIDLDKHGHRLYQINQTFHEGYNSKGIGLFLVQQQAEAIGASLNLTSEVSKGSTFTIVLNAE